MTILTFLRPFGGKRQAERALLSLIENVHIHVEVACNLISTDSCRYSPQAPAFAG